MSEWYQLETNQVLENLQTNPKMAYPTKKPRIVWRNMVPMNW